MTEEEQQWRKCVTADLRMLVDRIDFQWFPIFAALFLSCLALIVAVFK